VIVCHRMRCIGIDLMVFNTLKEGWIKRQRALGQEDATPNVPTLVCARIDSILNIYPVWVRTGNDITFYSCCCSATPTTLYYWH